MFDLSKGLKIDNQRTHKIELDQSKRTNMTKTTRKESFLNTEQINAVVMGFDKVMEYNDLEKLKQQGWEIYNDKTKSAIQRASAVYTF